MVHCGVKLTGHATLLIVSTPFSVSARAQTPHPKSAKSRCAVPFASRFGIIVNISLYLLVVLIRKTTKCKRKRL